MDRTYDEEMATLRRTYTSWLSWRDGAVPDLASAAGPAIFVASGGSLAVAHLAAALHRQRTGALACALTPLEFIAMPVDVALVVVISDSVGHPDVLAALAQARRQTGARVVLLCNRERAELGDRAAGCELVTCPRPGRDGYVATNSVLSLSLGAITTYRMPGGVPNFDVLAGRWLDHSGRLRAEWDVRHRDVLCAYTPGLASVGVDLETRTAEAGLARVVTTDIRNLGHGRHVGLYRSGAHTSLIVLADEPWARLGRDIVDVAPPGLEVRVWLAAQVWPWSAVELLIPSFGFLAARAGEAGTDPGNPATWAPMAALFRLTVDAAQPTG